jgi:SAM-dependent methyltransferase
VIDRLRAPITPRSAVIWQVLRAELDQRAADGPLRIVDVGGGTGLTAVPLAVLGHQVTVVDSSPDALAALARRAAEHGVPERVSGVQGDADRLSTVIDPGSADLVLCHSVLEVVDDPAATIAAVAAALCTGGAVSVVVANRAAAVLSRALAGHFATAATLLDAPAGVGEGELQLRRFDPRTAEDLLAAGGLCVEHVHGVRVVADLVPGAMIDAEPGGADSLVALEQRLAATPPFRDIATQLHLLARKKP